MTVSTLGMQAIVIFKRENIIILYSDTPAVNKNLTQDDIEIPLYIQATSIIRNM